MGNYPITLNTPTHVLVAGAGGLISKVATNQLISNTDVTSVFGRTGNIVPSPADYTSDMVKEVTNLYFTNARARASISLTTVGSTGPATYNAATGVLNVPQYQNDFNGVSSFNTRTGAVTLTALDVTTALTYTPVAIETDPIWGAQKVLYYTKVESDANFASITHTHTTTVVTEGTNLYFTNTRARAAITLTTTGTSGAATYTNGVFNIPNYTTDLTGYATETYVNTQVSNLVDAAPTTLNTLNELAAALGDDANFSTTITTLIGTKEPSITAGTTAQYWRGDKTWQTLPTYNLSLYVTLATAQDISGNKTFTALSTKVEALGIKLTTGVVSTEGYLTLNSKVVGTVHSLILAPDSTTNRAEFTFNNTTLRTYALPNASGTLALTSDIVTYTLPTASTTVLGGVKVDGTTITISNGIISGANTYSLPIATTTVLGGIKVGTNLSIDANGVLSSTDTNTTYANFTRTVSGLVPNPGAATTNRYLREDGTWVIPPDTDTVYVHPTTAGNKHIPSGGAAGQILRWSADGTAVWGADNDTTYSVFTRSANGLAPAAPAGTGTTKYLREDGTWAVPPDTDTDTNTWNANTKDVAGYVSAPGAVANKVWKTDASGNPGWRDDADTDTNTTYTAGTGLTLTGTSFSVTKTITASETADTIALRNGSGQLVATGFYQASSRKLKTNINPFTRSALDIIREVSVVSFNYKTDVINKHIGFIAEDTPEELSTRNKNVMDANNTIGVLLKAIQELEAKVKELETKCNEK